VEVVVRSFEKTNSFYDKFLEKKLAPQSNYAV